MIWVFSDNKYPWQSHDRGGQKKSQYRLLVIPRAGNETKALKTFLSRARCHVLWFAHFTTNGQAHPVDIRPFRFHMGLPYYLTLKPSSWLRGCACGWTLLPVLILGLVFSVAATTPGYANTGVPASPNLPEAPRH